MPASRSRREDSMPLRVVRGVMFRERSHQKQRFNVASPTTASRNRRGGRSGSVVQRARAGCDEGAADAACSAE